LKIDGAAMPTNTIENFAVGETINLAGIAFSSGETASLSGTTLTVKNSGGTTLAKLTLTGVASGATFSVTADPTSGIDTIDPHATAHGADTVPAALSTIGRVPQFASSESLDLWTGPGILHGGAALSLPAAAGDPVPAGLPTIGHMPQFAMLEVLSSELLDLWTGPGILHGGAALPLQVEAADRSGLGVGVGLQNENRCFGWAVGRSCRRNGWFRRVRQLHDGGLDSCEPDPM
jgi:hypothetical protein